MQREHPINILRYAAKNIWLMIFPILRGWRSIRLNPVAFYHWLQGAWFDLLTLLVIAGIGYIRWRCAGFRAGETAFTLQSGVLVRRKTEIPYRNLAAVTAEHPFWLRPFFAVRLRLDTSADVLQTPHVKLLIRRTDYRVLKQRLHVPIADPKHTTYRPHWLNIVFFSLIFSSSLSGVVYIATFFFQFGRLFDLFLQESPARRFTNVTSEVTSEVSDKLGSSLAIANQIPPIALGIAIVLLCAWLLSFCTNMLRYIGFRYEQQANTLRIREGVLTRRRYTLSTQHINYVDLRQNMLMKLCRVMSVHLNCAGYGTSKHELPVMVPIIRRKEILDRQGIHLTSPLALRNQMRIPLSSWLTYLCGGFVAVAVLPFAAILLRALFPRLTDFVTFALIMLEIPAIWYLLVKIVEWLTTGITLADSQLCIRYCFGFRFHTILADTKNLAKVQILITPFQRLNHKCNLIFYFHGASQHGHMLCGIPQADAQALLSRLGMPQPDAKASA